MAKVETWNAMEMTYTVLFNKLGTKASSSSSSKPSLTVVEFFFLVKSKTDIVSAYNFLK